MLLLLKYTSTLFIQGILSYGMTMVWYNDSMVGMAWPWYGMTGMVYDWYGITMVWYDGGIMVWYESAIPWYGMVVWYHHTTFLNL